MVLSEQQFRRVAHLTKPVLTHLVDTEFGSTAETVLYASQDAVHIVLVSLKLKYRIDYMFQYLRSGNASLLIDMSNQYDRSSCFFGKSQYCSRTLSHLYNAAGR